MGLSQPGHGKFVVPPGRRAASISPTPSRSARVRVLAYPVSMRRLCAAHRAGPAYAQGRRHLSASIRHLMKRFSSPSAAGALMAPHHDERHRALILAGLPTPVLPLSRVSCVDDGIIPDHEERSRHRRGTAFHLLATINSALHTTTNSSSILAENLLRRIGHGQNHAS